LLLSYGLPYISPKTVPVFAVLSLAVPFLILANVAFIIYWLIRFKKHFILSTVVLAIGLLVSSPFFKFSEKKNYLNDDLTVMSYNVRMFNQYNSIKDHTISEKLEKLIAKKNPDVLAIQEYYTPTGITLDYKYQYFVPKTKHFGIAILSKYPIINKGSLDFEKTANNGMFIDILRGKDTIRIYNLHLQSLKLNPSKDNFGEESSEKLLARLENGFTKQANQAEKFLAHEKEWTGKKIVCGDFNNTAYSWVYRQIANNKKDAFIEAGTNTGRTFNYIFPLRIDFIFTDTSAEVNRCDVLYKKYSDHFPILARVNWNNN